MTKECEKCGQPFTEHQPRRTVSKNKYLYTVQEQRGCSEFVVTVDYFELCSQCSDYLYSIMQARGFRPSSENDARSGEVPELL